MQSSLSSSICFPSYAQNVVLTPEKKDQVARIRGGGGCWFGQCPKVNVFSTDPFPYLVFIFVFAMVKIMFMFHPTIAQLYHILLWSAFGNFLPLFGSHSELWQLLPGYLICMYFNILSLYVSDVQSTRAECDIRMDFDTNEYLNIFVSRKWHERISEYIRMNFFETNEYTNIFVSKFWYEQISE